ncbi:MAG TPA: energy transducer TonB, partial [Steroidobacteraceae bacterium]|nr:energy transducer TonB [Steroidobacteraceae bacterium]
LREIDGHLLEYLGDGLDAVTRAKPVAISPTIRFDEEPVRIRLPEKVGTYARLGCAADPDPACPSAPARNQSHCTGEIVHADLTWAPGPPPYTVQPRYPYEARQLGISGTVAVAAHVDSSGLLCSGVVVRIPAGNAGPLADAALDAIQYWQLDPAMRDGRPVESLRLLAVNFVLD